MELKVVELAIHAYPEALRLPDSDGCYPLHIVCRRETLWKNTYIRMNPWRRTTDSVLELVLNAYPEAASIQENGGKFTALHFICGTVFSEREPTYALQMLLNVYPEAVHIPDSCLRFPLHTICATDLEDRTTTDTEEHLREPTNIVKMLINLFPKALELPDLYGIYPLHAACESLREASVVKSLLRRFPAAAQIQLTCDSAMMGGRTPLLLNLWQGYNIKHYQVTRLLIETCPWTAAIEDKLRIAPDKDIVEPAGDALDYICVNYCSAVGVRWLQTEVYDEEGNDLIDLFDLGLRNYDGYIEANFDFLDGNKLSAREYDQEYIDATFEILLMILRVMHGRVRFLPLHAACQGLLCRPWNLVVLKELLRRFGEQAREKDDNGSLPLHLFLESCMVQQDKAINKKYAVDAQEYQRAIETSFELILEAYPRAAIVSNEDDRLPLHLALESRCLPNEMILESFVTPMAVRARDINSRLYPFASAAIGDSADLDLTFVLLRKDPSVLRDLGGFRT